MLEFLDVINKWLFKVYINKYNKFKKNNNLNLLRFIINILIFFNKKFKKYLMIIKKKKIY